jgi:hypothetical protein
LKSSGTIRNAKVSLEFPELEEKALVWLDAGPTPESMGDGVFKGSAILVHDIGEEEGG